MTEKKNIIANDDLVCEHCGQVVEHVHVVHTDDGGIECWCDECRDADAHKCENCGDWHESSVTVHSWPSDMQWCPDCAENYATQCERCGEWHVDDECHDVLQENGNYQTWCEDCIDRHATQCERCGEYFVGSPTEVVVLDGWHETEEHWCPDCVDSHASRCEHCERLFDEDDLEWYHVYNSGDTLLCESCVDNDYYTCENCGDLVYYEDVVERDYIRYCPDCAPSRELQSYHHTSGSTFWFADGHSVNSWELTDRKRMFLGIELETDDNDDAGSLASDVAAEFEDRLECKKDGSLHNEGVEIVSQPMEPMYHLNSGMWERVVDIVREHGGTSHDAGTCGLHIHISRAFFDDDAVYRLDRLYNRFRSQLVRFSRRREHMMRWCNIGEHDELAEIPDVEERKEEWDAKKKRAGRYEAVNNTNHATVEIRLWRGTLNLETLRATIELTTGLAMVANGITDELADSLGWDSVKLLTKFVLEENDIPHDDLDAYLARRGL